MTPEKATGPIACDFQQIPAQRRDSLLAQLRATFTRISRVTPLPNGFALEFPGDKGMVTELSQIIEYDRLCCPFIRHALLDEPGGGNITLELTGTTEVRNFLADELLSFLPPGVAVPTFDERQIAAVT
jgi:hypothetical protein